MTFDPSDIKRAQGYQYLSLLSKYSDKLPTDIIRQGDFHYQKLRSDIASLQDVPPVRVVKPMPDHVATLTGWRAWKVNKSSLAALGKDTIWEPKKAIAALCKNTASHSSPAKDCSCGYWSFKSMDLLKNAIHTYAHSVMVVGSVEIWGKVIECENGYRSEFAYPKELWLLKPNLDFLSWTYGVPVRKIPKCGE